MEKLVRDETVQPYFDPDFDPNKLQTAAQNAVACEKCTGLPAELTVAQWALESGWGLHQPGNNCFGIKAYSGCHGTQLLKTIEYVNGVPECINAEFATFASLEDCFVAHARLITQGRPYQDAWSKYKTSHDVLALIECIAPIYATAPGYAEMLTSIVQMPAVAAAIATARGH